MSDENEYYKVSFEKGERVKLLKQVIIGTVFYPVYLLLYLGDCMNFRGFTFIGYFLEYNYDLWKAWKAVLGIKVKRNDSKRLKSIQETLYRKKNRIDKDIYKAFTNRFPSVDVTLRKHDIRYYGHYEEARVKRVSKDNYLVRVYTDGGWSSRDNYINSDYLLSKQQVIDFLNTY